MARSKGSKRALEPLKTRDPEQFKLIKAEIERLGSVEVANKAGLSKELMRLFLKGEQGISENAERSILKGIASAKDAKKKVEEDLRKEALEVLTS